MSFVFSLSQARIEPQSAVHRARESAPLQRDTHSISVGVLPLVEEVPVALDDGECLWRAGVCRFIVGTLHKSPQPLGLEKPVSSFVNIEESKSIPCGWVARLCARSRVLASARKRSGDKTSSFTPPVSFGISLLKSAQSVRTPTQSPLHKILSEKVSQRRETSHSSRRRATRPVVAAVCELEDSALVQEEDSTEENVRSLCTSEERRWS